MAFNSTVLFLLLIMSPVATMAKKPAKPRASIQKLFATTSLAKDNDTGIHGKSLSEEMKEEIAAIKQVIQEQVLKRLDGLSTKADRCRVCPAGWVSHGSSCYYLEDTTTLKQRDARAKCQAMGGDLAIIRSEDERKFIFDLLNTKDSIVPGWGAWIGLERKAADSKFYWIDGTPLEGHFSAWDGREPNNSGGNENCVHMNKSVGRWNDIRCDLWSGNPVILCQKPL